MINNFWYQGEEYEVEDVTEFTETEKTEVFQGEQWVLMNEETEMVRIHLKDAPVESVEVESEQHEMLKEAFNE